MTKLFISYSKLNQEAARDLYEELRRVGFDPWIDFEELLPGQDWDLEIKKAIKSAPLVLICFSKEMMEARGYVHKEWQMVLDMMREVPEGKVYAIPVRLNECEMPTGLRGTQWADWFDVKSRGSLIRSIASVLGASSPVSIKSASAGLPIASVPKFYLEAFLAADFDMIRDDPYNSGYSEDEVKVKLFLKRNLLSSFDYLDEKNCKAIIALWQPLLDMEPFNVKYDPWRDAPFFRSQVQNAKSHLFFAHSKLSCSFDEEEAFKDHIKQAIACLREIVSSNPYSMSGPSRNQLPPEAARVQNENYESALQAAQSWFNVLGPELIGMAAGTPLEEMERIVDDVAWRLNQLKTLLE